MIDMSAMLDRLADWARFAESYWSVGPALDSFWTAVLALVVGLILSLWGARLLKAAYVIGFMVAGATVGMGVARTYEVDPLIGFVIGAGVLGLVGHLLYRWWIGLTAALAAAAIVVAVSAPWAPREAEAFADALLQQAGGRQLFAPESQPTSGSPAVVVAPGDLDGRTIDWLTVAAGLKPPEGQARPEPLAVLAAWVKALWAAVPDELRQAGLLAGVAGLLGLALGVVLPRFTTIVGTSAIGVLAMAGSVAYFLSEKMPGAWQSVQAQPVWFWACVGLILVVSLAFQARRGKLRQIAPVAPVEPAKT